MGLMTSGGKEYSGLALPVADACRSDMRIRKGRLVLAADADIDGTSLISGIDSSDGVVFFMDLRCRDGRAGISHLNLVV